MNISVTDLLIAVWRCDCVCSAAPHVTKMKVTALLLLAMVAGATALSTDVDAMWEEFKVKYNKGYQAEEHDMRREIFGRNWVSAHACDRR